MPTSITLAKQKKAPLLAPEVAAAQRETPQPLGAAMGSTKELAEEGSGNGVPTASRPDDIDSRAELPHGLGEPWGWVIMRNRRRREADWGTARRRLP